MTTSSALEEYEELKRRYENPQSIAVYVYSDRAIAELQHRAEDAEAIIATYQNVVIPNWQEEVERLNIRCRMWHENFANAEAERNELEACMKVRDNTVSALQAEVERLEEEVEDNAHGITYQRERAEAAEDEVERLTWMLEEFIAPEIRDEVIADLASRYAEREGV